MNRKINLFLRGNSTSLVAGQWRCFELQTLAFSIKALGIIGALLIFTSVIFLVGRQAVYLQESLLPVFKNQYPLAFQLGSDKDSQKSPGINSNPALDHTGAVLQEGSDIVLRKDNDHFGFDFTLKSDIDFPYIGVNIMFSNEENLGSIVDLSNYSSMTFTASCAPENTLLFSVFTFDSGVSKLGDILSYRRASTYFDCDATPKLYTIDLTRLVVPDWWLMRFNFKYSDKKYQLENSLGFEFSNSIQSPKDKPSVAEVSAITFYGNDRRYYPWALLVIVIAWFFGAFWLFRIYKNKLLNDVNVQVLKIIAAREAVNTLAFAGRAARDDVMMKPPAATKTPLEEETEAVIWFLSNEYSNVDMSLGYAVEQLGLNRNKINAILRDSAGLTFTHYLNKLRLDEAGRLLTSQEEYRIATIAHAIGYNNVNYFNRAFKSEYGCSPKEYRLKHLSNDAS